MGPAGRLEADGTHRLFPTIVRVVAVDAHYLYTMRLPVTAGRGFVPADDAGPLVAVVSASMARQLGSQAGALGRRIQLPWGRDPGAPIPVAIVVGIVADVVTDVRELQPLTIYVPLARYPPQTYRTLTVRTAAGGRRTGRAGDRGGSPRARASGGAAGGPHPARGHRAPDVAGSAWARRCSAGSAGSRSC